MDFVCAAIWLFTLPGKANEVETQAMAKESTASRLPMPGLSRIPLPGLLRTPTISLARTSQIRPPTTFVKVRPTSYSGLKAPTQQELSIKKSHSGDRINTINSTVNMVSKKTTTVFKKFFAKPEQTPAKKDSTVTISTSQNETSLVDTTKPTLARSETFVRTESSDNLMATPMPVVDDAKKGTFCGSTPVLSTNTKHILYSPDTTFTPNADSETISMQRKHTLETTQISSIGFDTILDMDTPKNKQQQTSMGFGNTIDIDSPRNVTKIMSKAKCSDDINNCTQVLNRLTDDQTFNKKYPNKEQNRPDVTHSIKENNRPDATYSLNNTEVLERTLCVISGQPGKTNENSARSLDSIQLMDKISNVGLTQTIDGATKLIEHTDIHSPATNATYSNPGSSENLLMIDDVSIPSGFEEDVALDVQKQFNHKFFEITAENLDDTLMALAPNKANMKLPLNSTNNTERLLDISEHMSTPAKHLQLLNLTKDYMDTPNVKNTTQLLYMTQISSASCTTTPDRNTCKKLNNPMYHLTPPAHLQSPTLLKGAQSDLVLPIHTPDEDIHQEAMDIEATLISTGARTEAFYQQAQISQVTSSLQDINNPNKKNRFSFGLDLTESTLDCSIELVDVSLSSTVLSQGINTSCNNNQNMYNSNSTQQQYLKKQNSFDMDESLGILTPDQMKEFLDSTATNNTNNLDLPLLLNNSNNNNLSHKLALQQMRIDQTPSPEELPLDPVEVKTDINDMVLQHQQLQLQQQQQHNSQNQVAFSSDDHQQQGLESLSLHTDTEPSKTDTINKSISSSVSKISTSFITSVTSVTSLDTGYQGDGEMSRPASRGPCDHSPSNGPVRKGVSRQPSFNQQQGGGGHLPLVRRQDPMTDSDFFTESDADDVFHRGDRRAQVIDGQLYGPMLQPAASVFISEDPQMEDSCMESSGIFTDVENRGDEDLAQMRRQDTHETANDLSPDNDLDGDDSTETVRSNRESVAKRFQTVSQSSEKSAATMASGGGSGNIMSITCNSTATCHGQGQLSISQTSSTIQSSMSTDRLSADTFSNRTSYCSVDGNNVNSISVEFKSFSSLDEAFNGEHNHYKNNIGNDYGDNSGVCRPVKLTKSSTTSTTSWCEQPMKKYLMAVHKESSVCKHLSLTSLSTENSVHNNTTVATTLLNLNKSSHKQSDQESLRSGTVSGSGTGSKSSLNESVKSSKRHTANAVASGKYSPRYKTNISKSAKLRSFPNQTNKSENNSSPVVRKYYHSTNKWDAVMNQIANNKAVIRKNYNDVKSKVSTRITTTTGTVNGTSTVGRGASCSSASVSPTQRRPPFNNLSINRNLSSSVSKVSKTIKSPSPSAALTGDKNLDTNNTSTKRILQNAHINRGRSYSKDSQKSSHSDLSLGSAGVGCGVNNGSGVISAGSPKQLAKTPMRAAKKRDVRNLSISPTDLGPPPKTQQTANGSSTRQKAAVITLTQKRFSSNVQITTSPSPSTTSTAASTPTGGSVTSIKGSAPTKKFTLHGKRLDVKTTTISSKAPLKAQNLHASSSTSTSSLFLSTSSTSSADVDKSLKFSQTASGTLEMLKNHKNSKLPKFNLNDFPISDVKFSRNMTLTTIKPPRQKGIILSTGGGVGVGVGVGVGENSDSIYGGKSGRNNRNAVTNSSSATIHKFHSSSSASLAVAQTNAKVTSAITTITALDATSLSTTCTSTTSSTINTSTAAVAQTCSSITANEMDLLKAPGLRKKSSFLWNSFRMPRKQKGDHNRILTQTIATPTVNNKSVIGKPETSASSSTEHQENSGINNNNNINEKKTGTTAITRINPKTSSPTILTNSATTTTTVNNKKTPASPAVTTASNTNEKKLQSKLQNSSTPLSSERKLLLQKQHQQQSEDTFTNNSSLELNDELQQLKYLNRHSCNGSINYQTFEQQQQQLQELRKQQEHQTKSTEALGVLLQYLVYDLDAFACPSLKSKSSKTKKELKKTLLLLEETKNVCSELQDQLCDKDAYYTRRENELQALHCCELEKVKKNLLEFQTMAKQQTSSLELQLQDSEKEYKRLLESYRLEMEHKLSQKQQQLDTAEEHAKSLNERLQTLGVSEQQLRTQLMQIESSYVDRLKAASEREQELSERLKQLTKELDKLKALKENSERELKEKLNLSNDEVAVLRTSRRSLNESSVSSPRNTSSLTSSSHMEIIRLQSEAESLRCVLELKQKEISKLTKKNEELLRDADEKSALQAKISLLESKNEMLHSELEIKSEKEKEYLRQIDEVQKAYSHETVKRTRLSYDNEALQWQLKQRSEQLHIVETKLQELSAHDISTTSLANRSSQNGTSLTSSIHIDDISPPTSPVIKGVIEKTDSVSWVLEMDDETPEVAASKMVKRAGSFRSVERSPSTRRQLSVSASATCGGNTQNCNSSLMEVAGPNPLSQSMSATSVIREHSKVETNEFNNRSHSRIRSKSVSIKGCEQGSQQQSQPKSSKKMSRQLSGGSSSRKNELTTNWKEPVLTSSPYVMRPRSSTLKMDSESEEMLFRRTSASKLITCDTSALNKGERLEMRSLPSHPSVQDLKVIKKSQEIQESAGEAMVSGTNSEDESCSASSDDVVSTASSSTTSDSTTSSNQLKNSRMSFEEVLLIEKINSLSGTPMEVSWSEDAEGLTNSSTL